MAARTVGRTNRIVAALISYALCAAAATVIVGCGEKKPETGETRVSIKSSLARGVDPMRARTKKKKKKKR